MSEFNLSLVAYSGEQGGMTIWDGQEFVYTESKGWGWGYWDIAKMCAHFFPVVPR